MGPRIQLLESIEGTADQLWPSSPPFQEAHLEPRADGRQVVLLVGMAGSSHWSASVEIDPQTHTALFDVACRMRGPADWLGSRYRILTDVTTCGPGRIRLAPDGSPELAGRERSIWLELAGGGDPAVLRVEGDELHFAVEAVESAPARTALAIHRLGAGAAVKKGPAFHRERRFAAKSNAGSEPACIFAARQTLIRRGAYSRISVSCRWISARLAERGAIVVSTELL